MVKGVTAFDWDKYHNPDKILFHFWEKKQHIDVVLMSLDEEEEIPAHQVVLSALSKKLWDHMNAQLQEKDAPTVTVTDFKGKESKVKKVLIPVRGFILKAMVDAAYTEEMKSDALQIWPLLQAAEFFHIEEMEKACCSYVSRLVNADNCIEMYRLAMQKEHPKLFQVALDSVKKNFLKIVESAIFFIEMDSDSLIRVLSSDYLNIPCEEAVWEGMKKWVLAKPSERGQLLPKLLKKIRFLRTQPTFLPSLLQDPLVQAVDTSGQTSHLIQHMITARENSSLAVDGYGLPIALQQLHARPRVPCAILFAVGGWKNSRCSRYVEVYDLNTNRWYELPHMTDCPTVSYHGTQILERKIVLVGGTDGHDIKEQFVSWDMNTGVWKQEPGLSCKRCYVSTAVVGGKLYAIGGHNGHFRVRSVECFDPRINEWTPVADMIVARSDASSAVINGKIYVAGGLNENQIENSVEVYDPEMNTWTLLSNMVHARTSFSVVALDGFLYAIGGNNGDERQSSVERLDPSTNTWTEVAALKVGRSTFSAAVLQGKIMVVGGYDGRSPICSVEAYDPITNSWTERTSMGFSRSGLSTVVVSTGVDLKKFSHLGLVIPPRVTRRHSLSAN